MSNDMQNEFIYDAKVRFRNFAGRAKQYNAEGDRNFVIFLEDNMAKDLLKKGWNVKQLNPREEGDSPQPYLEVTVKYTPKARPPKVVLVSSNGQTMLGEDTIEMLDYAEIVKVDLSIRPYSWSVNGASGVKAYLQSIYVTIYEDELDLAYSQVKLSETANQYPADEPY